MSPDFPGSPRGSTGPQGPQIIGFNRDLYINLKRLRPFRRPLKRRRIIRFVTFQNECQLSCNLGLEGIEIFMVSTVFSGLLHHEDSWLRCFEIVPKSLYNLPKSFKNRLKIVVCGGPCGVWRGVLGRLGGVLGRRGAS